MVELDAFGARELVRLLLLSGLFTIVAWFAYPNNAQTRKWFVAASIGALIVLPWLLAVHPVRFELPMSNPPLVDLALPSWLVWIWMCVAVVLGVLCVARAVLFQRRLHAGEVFPDCEVVAQTQQLAQALNLPRVAVRVCTAEQQGPGSGTLCGPLLVLPEGAAGWPAATLRAVICHELVHIRRRDDLLMLLVRLACLFYWWMPWLQLARRSLEQAIEESCDDRASEHYGCGPAYVEGLVDGAGRCLPRAPLAPQLAQLGAHPMVRRVQRFGMDRVMDLDSRGAYWMLVTVLAVVIVLTGLHPVALRSEPQTGQNVVRLAGAALTPAGPGSIVPVVRARLSSAAYRAAAPQPLPIYPGSALIDEIEGQVTVEFEMGGDGRAYRVRVISAHPDRTFVPSALNALKATQYNKAPQSPALNHRPRSKPVKLRQIYDFELHRL